MRISLYLILLFLVVYQSSNGQNGLIVSKELIRLTDKIIHRIDSLDPNLNKELEQVNLYRIVYKSDSINVVGFMAEPKKSSKYPCIIANRGGRSNFGLWKPFTVAFYLGRMASWGYVVVASQYRGSIDGGQGRDEFGGKDLNDVFNLVPVLAQQPNADTSRIGMYGESRGGMMTYLALRRSCKFKGAVVVAGVSNAFALIEKRPELEGLTFRTSIPDYSVNKENALQERSAALWASEMCSTTPLLLMHGSADENVDARQSLLLTEQLYECKHPVRFILYEGADHFISQFEMEMLSQCKAHFDSYVRDRKPLPKL